MFDLVNVAEIEPENLDRLGASVRIIYVLSSKEPYIQWYISLYVITVVKFF
jgi:hypothetical protein